MRNLTRRSTCPISTALDVLGDKWSLLVVRDLLFEDELPFGAFLKSDPHIATNILVDRLATLREAGIIEQREKPGRRSPVYALTPKGRDLAPLLVEIVAWSEKHYECRRARPTFAEWPTEEAEI
jgi:DNA-binding HxlR family transcriptional regulator